MLITQISSGVATILPGDREGTIELFPPIGGDSLEVRDIKASIPIGTRLERIMWLLGHSAVTIDVDGAREFDGPLRALPTGNGLGVVREIGPPVRLSRTFAITEDQPAHVTLTIDEPVDWRVEVRISLNGVVER